MTTIGPNERSSYPLEAQVYYVPDQTASDRTTLNRVVNSSATDHADTITSLHGYSQDMELGFPWTNGSAPGLAQLDESYSSATGDYALFAPAENFPGYVPQPLAAYGYPRYGNASEVLLSLSAGGVTVQSNAVAGGATWRGRCAPSEFAYTPLILLANSLHALWVYAWRGRRLISSASVRCRG